VQNWKLPAGRIAQVLSYSGAKDRPQRQHCLSQSSRATSTWTVTIVAVFLY